MPDNGAAESAINGLEGKELKGRALKVNKARPRSEGQGRRSSGGGGGGGGGRRPSGGGGGRRSY